MLKSGARVSAGLDCTFKLYSCLQRLQNKAFSQDEFVALPLLNSRVLIRNNNGTGTLDAPISA